MTKSQKNMRDLERIVQQIAAARGKVDLGVAGTMRHTRWTAAWNIARSRGLI